MSAWVESMTSWSCQRKCIYVFIVIYMFSTHLCVWVDGTNRWVNVHWDNDTFIDASIGWVVDGLMGCIEKVMSWEVGCPIRSGSRARRINVAIYVYTCVFFVLMLSIFLLAGWRSARWVSWSPIRTMTSSLCAGSCLAMETYFAYVYEHSKCSKAYIWRWWAAYVLGHAQQCKPRPYF